MPSSGFGQIGTVVDAVGVLEPHVLLDVGCGNGKYGFLCREFLYYSRGITPVIDAIEAFPDYIGPLQREVYDTIYISEATKQLRKFTSSSYDLVLAIEILEHFSREDGLEFLQELIRVGKHVIVSCPKRTATQGAFRGNDYEIHRSQWHLEDFKKMGDVTVLPDPDSQIVVIGPDARKVQVERIKFKILHRLVKLNRRFFDMGFNH